MYLVYESCKVFNEVAEIFAKDKPDFTIEKLDVSITKMKNLQLFGREFNCCKAVI